MTRGKNKTKCDVGQEMIDGLTELRDALRSSAPVDEVEFKRELERGVADTRAHPEDGATLDEVMKRLRDRLRLKRRKHSRR